MLCLHVQQPASGSEEGGSQFMQNTEKCCVLFVHSLVQDKETHTTSWIMCDVSLEHQVF